MMLAYCQFLLVIASLVSHLHLSMPLCSTTATTNPAVRLTPRYDPDNESLGPPYDLRVVGNGNCDDDGGMTSRNHDDGCQVAAAGPTQIPETVTAADVLMSQSHSI